ncbi:sulfite exporter TauE/SafE family protein [bacterium]|nr:sulfite exporter TauE/SafE family protein [bacterium]
MKTMTCEFSVDGMHCDACELYLEETLKKQEGVVGVNASSDLQKVEVTINSQTNIELLRKNVNKKIALQGYRIVSTVEQDKNLVKKFLVSGVLASIIFLGYLLLQRAGFATWFEVGKLTYSSIFLLGVLASLSTCMAVVGGISMTLSSKFAAEKKSQSIVTFHVARIVGFIILGGVIALLGRAVMVNATISAILRIIVAIAMIGVGAELLGFHLPKITFPKFVARAFGLFDDKEGWSGAVLLGVGTFFMPCAFTQSMELYAMSTGSFIIGALVMGTFALGTLPVLGLVSFGAAKGVMTLNKTVFGYTMGYLIALFALLNIVTAVGVF